MIIQMFSTRTLKVQVHKTHAYKNTHYARFF